MNLIIHTNQYSDTEQQSRKNKEDIQDNPAYSNVSRLTSKGRFHQLNFDAYYLEYRARGVLRWFLAKLGLNTRLEIPTNIIIKSRLRYGLWLELTIQNYSIRTNEIKISHLTPVFLPGLILAGKCQKTIVAIIHRNRNLANPEMYFVMPGQTEKTKNAPVQKAASQVGHIRLMGYPGKELA
ncbi:MAG: hypothetical protein HEP71_30445 [Roseivirga sp.]|nr:hypothetical protein [Roseivirga sp.]